MRNLIFTIILIAGFFNFAVAQPSTAYRNKNWNPKAGKYFFSTMLTWSFENEMATDEHLKKGEINIYVDEKTGTFLFTKEAYGWSGEMIDFVITDQKGNYIIGHTDEFGKKHRETINALLTVDKKIQPYKSALSDFKKYSKSTGNSKVFGKNNYGWPTKTGMEYILYYQQTEDNRNLFLSTEKYSFLPLFLFNKLEFDAKLPIHFDYSLILGTKFMPLEYVYEWNGKKSKLTFISMSPTEYFIDLNDYKK